MSTHSSFITVIDDIEPGPVYTLQVPKTMKMKAIRAMGASMVIMKGFGMNIHIPF